MEQLPLHAFHQALGARFEVVNGKEVVGAYSDEAAEAAALHAGAGILDLSFRGRLCLTGSDRTRFLHGQATNDIKRLRVGDGCYAALVTAKGRMESDLSVHCLAEELLLDFEPGMTERVTQRLESFIVADDVQVVNVAAHYGLLSVQGPSSDRMVKCLELFNEIPSQQYGSAKASHELLGELYVVRNSRLGTVGFDLFIPTAGLAEVAEQLMRAGNSLGGRAAGWRAFETARVEAGIPRFGADMDETNLPQECGIEARAVSYSKGCYIGQEVLNRLHTMGHVNRALRMLELAPNPNILPRKGDKLVQNGKEVGFITSAVHSVRLQKNVALGYVRREVDAPGGNLSVVIGTELEPVRFVGAFLKRSGESTEM